MTQFFKPEDYFEVREALLKAGRGDLIGSGCDALIPAHPPRATLHARMEKAAREITEGRYMHTIPVANNPMARKTTAGYRPGRKSAWHRSRKGVKGADPRRRAQPPD